VAAKTNIERQGDTRLARKYLSCAKTTEGALATLEQVASGAQVLQGTRGEARETVESIVYHWGKKV